MEAGSFGLLWNCGFGCMNTWILDFKSKVTQLPAAACLSAAAVKHTPGLPPIRWQRSIKGLRSLLSLLFWVPAAPLQLNLNSLHVPEDKNPFNSSRAEAGPRVWCWYQAVGVSPPSRNYSVPPWSWEKESWGLFSVLGWGGNAEDRWVGQWNPAHSWLYNYNIVFHHWGIWSCDT